MAIQVQGNNGIIADVDGTTFRAIRVTSRPIEYGALGYYRISAISGTMAAALAANSEIWQFRWPDATRFAVVYRISMSAGANVAATAAALSGFRVTAARAWTAAGTGGTRQVLTGNNSKLRTSMGTSLVSDIGISTTALLSPGTKTLDTSDMGSIAIGIGTGAITTSISLTIMPQTEFLDNNGPSDHPFVFATNEGYVIRSNIIMPATMTWHFAVNTSWAEVAAF
jgi:hypothetical protein